MKIPTYRIELVRDGFIEAQTFWAARDCVQAMKPFYRSDREHFVAFYLDARNRIIAHSVISTGTLNASLVHPREVFKTAILKNAAAFIVAHNHPSGGTEPSEGDIEVTHRLKKAGELLGIELIDHIIVAPNKNYKSIM